MKEIQFRAKDLEGNWVYGYYFIDSFNGSYCLKVGNCQYATEEYIYGFQVVGNITDNKEMLV